MSLVMWSIVGNMFNLKHYNMAGGKWNIPDEVIEGLFDRMEAEGKTRFAFPCKDDPII